MVAAPPFSHILPEGGGSHQMFTVGDMAAGSSQVAASVFLDDATVIAGMQKGFQLGTYRCAKMISCCSVSMSLLLFCLHSTVPITAGSALQRALNSSILLRMSMAYCLLLRLRI